MAGEGKDLAGAGVGQKRRNGKIRWVFGNFDIDAGEDPEFSLIGGICVAKADLFGIGGGDVLE